MFGENREHYERKFVDLECHNQLVEEVEFHDCIFKTSSFRETTFKDCKFIGFRFVGCNLSLAKVEGSTFSHVCFKDSQLVGVNWALANWSERSLLKSFDFYDCVLNYSVFMGMELKEVKMVGCMAKGADFSDADLRGADFSRTDLNASRFMNTNLSGADFSQASNYQIDATQNRLKKAKFSLPEAMSLLYCLDIELVE